MDAKIDTGQGKIHPRSLVFPLGDKIEAIEYKDSDIDFSIILMPEGEGFRGVAYFAGDPRTEVYGRAKRQGYCFG